MPKIRTGEAEISEAVLLVLSKIPSGEASIQQLVARIPKEIKLTEGDLAQSDTRPHEAVWEQIVRNIVSHKGVEGNIIAEGLVNRPSRGKLRITDAGRLYINNKTG